MNQQTRARSLSRDTHDVAFVVVSLLVACAFVPRMFGADLGLLTGDQTIVFGALAKFGVLLSGAYWAWRARASFEADNEVRSAWTGVAVVLALFAAGQSVLVYYQAWLELAAPHPMLGDVPFVLGTVLLAATLLRFVLYYARAGMVEVKRGPVAIAAGVTALLVSVVAYATVAGLLSTDAPVLGRIVSGIYPVLDCITLVSTVALLRILSPFRGGALWGVWLRMIAGFGLFTVGDIAFAYASTQGDASLSALFEAMFAWGYTFVAWGAYRQFRLGRCDDVGT